jgi:lysylphosphatidylglycerol synthetase-like protein (DUF2156 family)
MPLPAPAACAVGTLKLLYEEVFAVAKREGREMVSFGFSPFFNLQKEPFCGPFWAEGVTRFLFNFGNNLYQFKNLAFSKARCAGGGRRWGGAREQRALSGTA